MMTKKDLAGFTARIGFNVWQVEKDYLQHLILLFLSKYSKGEFVFKGGTALQKAYGLNRFSIDLDFTSKQNISLQAIIEKVNGEINKFGYASEFRKIKEQSGVTFLFRMRGPLYDGSEKSVSTLYVEISLRESILTEPKALQITPAYPDTQSYISVVMSLEEIMAEKVRAIMNRNKARDVYDLWFMLRRGIKIDESLANEKLKLCKMKFTRKEFIHAVRNKNARWIPEMRTLLADVPDFRTIAGEIENAV